jgi:hypothetical protein
MEFDVGEVHKKVREILAEETNHWGNLPKLADKIHLKYQRLWEYTKQRKGTKQLPAEVIAHLIYYLEYSPYYLLFGIGDKKKSFKK